MKLRYALFLLLLTAATLSPATGTTYQVEAVEDGDTLVLRIGGKSERVQLFGIDAPESVQNPKLKRDMARTGLDATTLLAIGQKATRHLQGLIRVGDAVRLEGDLGRRDKYGRISVIVIDPDGAPLNDAMVAQGYAVVLNRYPLAEPLKSRLLGAQTEAIRTHQGLWGSDREVALAWAGLAP